MQRILLATVIDGTASDNVAAFALSIAHHFDAHLTVYHAYGKPAASLGSTPETVREERVLAKMREMMDRITGPSYAHVEVEYATNLDYAGDGILDRVATGDYDLLVVGLRDGTEAFTSVSFRLLREAKIDVLAVPPQANFQGINEIVFATNLDAADEVALHQLQAWRQRMAAQLRVVNIYEVEDARAAAQEVLSMWRARYADSRNIHFEVIKGEFEEDILSYARTRSADMLVLQQSTKSFFGRLFGSDATVELAQRDVDLPLLVIRG